MDTGSRKENASKQKPLLNLRRGRIGRTLVVDPADFQVIALLATLEAELDVGVLGDRRSPIRDEDALAVILEGQFLDEMWRNDLALGVLDEAGIHRMLDQRLDFGGLSARSRAHANSRRHHNTPLFIILRMILSETGFDPQPGGVLFRIMRFSRRSRRRSL